MVHSTVVGPSLTDVDMERAIDISLDVRSLSTDFGDTSRSPSGACAFQIEHTASCRRNKSQRGSLGLLFNSRDSGCVRASYSPSYAYRLRIRSNGSDKESTSPTLSRFPTRKLPALPCQNRSSSGQSSPQTAYTSAGFSSSRGSPSSSRSSPQSSYGSFTNFSPLFPDHSRTPLPRIQVSSLLSDPRSLTYQLEVIQHPQKAAEFTNGLLSRLPVTPPMVVRLTIHDTSGNPVIPEAELPFLLAHLSLYSENGQRVDVGPSSMHGGPIPILYGNLVSSVDQLEDLQGNRGLFFLFPDVSIQWRGRYQLGVTLLRISSSSVGPSGNLGLAQHGQGLAETRTRVFEVFPRNQYTAAPQTRLTQSFLRQGARMFTFVAPAHP